MSRYQWPPVRKSKDRVRERAKYNTLTNGKLSAGSAPSPAATRSLPISVMSAPPVGPAGDANLWVPIGPSAVISGMAGSRPRISGRVRDIAVSPNGNRAYAATANGGVWYTSDAGITWSPLGNWIPTPTTPLPDRAAEALACGCLLVTFDADPNANGSGDDVYVGTGEFMPDVPEVNTGKPGSKIGGIGILHLNRPLPAALADPFGNHWKREAKNLAGVGIFRLARDPGNANTLVAATSIGLFTRSGPFVEDADWTQVVVAPFNFNEASGKRITDVAWLSAPARLWVALSGSSGTGIYTSTAGLAGPFQPITPLTNIVQNSRLGIAVAPSDNTIVYVLGKGPGLWRISGVAATEIVGLPIHLFGEPDQSAYDLAIAVDPTNSNVVVVGGASLFSNSPSLPPEQRGLPINLTQSPILPS